MMSPTIKAIGWGICMCIGALSAWCFIQWRLPPPLSQWLDVARAGMLVLFCLGCALSAGFRTSK